MRTLIATSVLTALLPLAAHAAPAPESRSWQAKMRDLERTLQEMLIDVSSDERFNSPKNFKRIERNAEKLASLALELKSRKGASPDADPSIPLIARQFAEDAGHASRALAWGHRAYARDQLRSMTGYCIACHTRSGGGPSFQSLVTAPAAEGLRGADRGDYFAAVRQFDRALEEYDRVISDSKIADEKSEQWERAVRAGLAIAIRVKKDPDRAASIVDRVLAAPQTALFFKENATSWKNQLTAWKKEPGTHPQTEEGYYVRAMRLISEAKAAQEYPMDRSADVLYLRASAAVHDLMTFAPNGAHATDALYLAGICYEVLDGLNLWDAHEFYYLACILKSPHTERARQCFRRYQESVHFGYTGSGGTHLPSDVRERLQELEGLAKPTNDAGTPLRLQ
jgi:cytochrome c553